MTNKIHYKLKADIFTKKALKLINFKALGRREILNLKRKYIHCQYLWISFFQKES